MTRTGRYAILEQFVADGVTHIFGNPGTVEQGFLDALGDFPSLHYILTLQESIAIMAADGYARAAKRPAIAQIHSSPGLGNAIGAIYQAQRGHAPIVIIGGDAGIKYQAMDAQMAADLVSMAKPVTKWSTMVQHPSSLLRTLRRAYKIAATPPMGPVYVCLPQDVMDEVSTESVFPTSLPVTYSLPAPELVEQAATMLAEAERPTFYVGDGVAWAGAQPELQRLAELLGADVWGSDAGELNLPYTHPLWRGQTGHMFGPQSLPIAQAGDVNFVVGTYIFPEVFPELGDIWAAGARTIHVDLNAYEIAKNHPVDLGLVADPKLTLAAIADLLEGKLSQAQKAAARAKLEQAGAAKAAQVEKEKAADRARGDATPLHFSRLVMELAPRLPADTVLFDEGLTSSPDLTRWLPPTTVGQFLQTRGGSLGVALASGIGVQVANHGKTVLAVSGDGGAMYTIQSLWSAARHNLPVKYIVCNNRSYRLLQANISQYWSEQGVTDRPFPLSFDLSKPDLQFAEMAKALGVAGRRVQTAEEIVPAVEEMLAHNGPFLLDVVLEGNVHPELIGVRCGQ
ncbi:MAG: thiamine pyrophosphate-binding protein [Chloroflexi bacterium]|nr:thiamine pyrophosphate-binding protein [Chloroflexota bacterium]